MILNFAKRIVKSLRKKEIISVPQVVDYNRLLKDKFFCVLGGTGGIGFSIAKSVLQFGGGIVLTGANENKSPGNPPAVAGGLAKFDSSGNVSKKKGTYNRSVNRSKQHTGGKYARLRKSKPYDMGLQVPYRMDTKIPEEKAV